MPSINENYQKWNDDSHWSNLGDEWSGPWGGSSNLWHYTLLPRLRHLLPAGQVIEIAPGHGRWTQFLAPLSGALHAVDLSERCIEICQKRFAAIDNITYHVNDGKSLPAEIPDGSVDLVFSFDSLVHCDLSIIDAYLEAIARKLDRKSVV